MNNNDDINNKTAVMTSSAHINEQNDTASTNEEDYDDVINMNSDVINMNSDVINTKNDGDERRRRHEHERRR